MAKDDAKGNQNYLHPEFWKPMVDYVNGTIVECNTAYGDASGGVRDNTESHLKLLEERGWNKYFKVDLMDAEVPDVVWPVEGGKVHKTNAVGKNILNYDSMLVLAHFKGQPMGGYGGALKQLSTGCAFRAGKALIHSAGASDDRYECWEKYASHILFPEAMADAAVVSLARFPEITERTVLHGPPRRGLFLMPWRILACQRRFPDGPGSRRGKPG